GSSEGSHPRSRAALLQPVANDVSGRVVLGIADDLDASAAFDDGVALGDAVGGVVGAFGVNVRANFLDEGADVELGEAHDGVDVGQCSKNFSALLCRHQGTARAFQGTNRFVGIDRDH